MKKAFLLGVLGIAILLGWSPASEAGGRLSVGIHVGPPIVSYGFGYGHGWHGHRRWSHGHYWGHAWVWGPPVYVYSPPAYVYSPPAVVVQEPPVYVQKEPDYWYYCEPSRAYYPYVKECSTAWLKVAPQAPPASGAER